MYNSYVAYYEQRVNVALLWCISLISTWARRQRKLKNFKGPRTSVKSDSKKEKEKGSASYAMQ